MAGKRLVPLSLIATGLAWMLECTQAFSASPLPKATVEMLRELKLSGSILGDMEKELQVPADWLEKAKKEGRLVFHVPPTSGQVSTAPFEERYPFIKIEAIGRSRPWSRSRAAGSRETFSRARATRSSSSGSPTP
jgi:hypothetical protein